MSESVHTPPPAPARDGGPRPRVAPGRPDPARPAPAAVGEVAVAVDAGARFEGVLACPKDTRIEGCLKGEVNAVGRVELGVDARVEGRIEAREIVVAGHFDGLLAASHAIELRETARVTGELRAPGLSAAEGCVVKGRCRTAAAEGRG